jgi:hypothetical protein
VPNVCRRSWKRTSRTPAARSAALKRFRTLERSRGERYHADTEYRERIMRDNAARNLTPEARERAAALRRERRLTDPEYRERINAQARARWRKQRDSDSA